MPNWISNKITAPNHVIAAMLDEHGDVDFGRIVPMGAKWTWEEVCSSAELLARTVLVLEIEKRDPAIPPLFLWPPQTFASQSGAFKALNDESFEQFVQMLRNYRTCGSLLPEDFALQHWGTKCNPVKTEVDPQAGVVSFYTAGFSPIPLLEALSRRFPDELIEVVSDDPAAECGYTRHQFLAGKSFTPDKSD
jgi:hypothetical protein